MPAPPSTRTIMAGTVTLPLEFLSQLLSGGFSAALAATWEALGVPDCHDANSGELAGYTGRLMMVDREAGVRASAAKAFFYPVSGRPNLRLIQGTARAQLTMGGEYSSKDTGSQWCQLSGWQGKHSKHHEQPIWRSHHSSRSIGNASYSGGVGSWKPGSPG